jgi:hypothetical protein
MCETWGKNTRWGYLSKGVLSKISGNEREDTEGEWEGVHNDELYRLYLLPNIIRVIKSRSMSLAQHIARMRDRRGAYTVCVEKRKRKRSLGSHRRRWEVNIKMNLQEVRWGMEWIYLSQDKDTLRAVVNAVMNPSCFIRCREFLD